MKLRDRALGLCVVAILAVNPRWATAGATDSPSPLAEIPKLERRISFSAAKVALADLVAKVVAETGAPLTTAEAVADEPVAVAVNNIPARELLERVAKLLGYRWMRAADGPGAVEINQDPASQEREETLRREARAEGERRFQEEVRRYTEAAAMTPEQIKATVLEIQRRRKQLAGMTPAQRASLFQSPQEWERIRRAAVVQRMTSPLTRALAGLLGRITTAQWTALRSEGALDFSSEPHAGEYPLPADLAAGLRNSPPKRAPATPALDPRRFGAVTSAAGKSRPMPAASPRDPWTAASGFRVIVRMDSGRLSCSGGIALLLRVTPILTAEALRGNAADARRSGSLLVEVNALDGRPGTGPAGVGERTLTAAAPAVRKRFQTRLRPRVDPSDPTVPAAWRFADLMPEIARTYGVQIITDAYWGSPLTLEGRPLPAEPIPVSALAQEFAGAGHTWECDGKWLVMRSRTWYFDRLREIPLRVVREWQSALSARGALAMDDCARLAAKLSMAQLRTLGAVVEQLDLPQDVLALPAARPLLLLYATLAPAQRQALWAGKPLRVAEMTSRQRELWLETLRDRSRQPGATLLSAEAPGTGGSLELRSSPYVRIAERWADRTTYRAELPGDSAVNAPFPTAPGGRAPRVPPVAEDAELPASIKAAAARPRPQSATRHVVTQVVFTLRSRNDRSVVVALTTAPP